LFFLPPSSFEAGLTEHSLTSKERRAWPYLHLSEHGKVLVGTAEATRGQAWGRKNITGGWG